MNDYKHIMQIAFGFDSIDNIIKNIDFNNKFIDSDLIFKYLKYPAYSFYSTYKKLNINYYYASIFDDINFINFIKFILANKISNILINIVYSLIKSKKYNYYYLIKVLAKINNYIVKKYNI